MPPSARPPIKKLPVKGSSTPQATPKGSAAQTPKSKSPPQATPKGSPVQTPKGSMAEQIKAAHANDGHRDQNREKYAGSSANQFAAKGAQFNSFIREGATKTFSEVAKLKPASHYEALATEFEARAAAEEAQAGAGDSLLSRFGATLSQKKIGKLDEKANIVKEWDKNGDGKISLSEFRIQVKSLNIAEDDCRRIDELFKSFDKDNSGFLEIAELKVAFKRAMVAASAAQTASQDVRDKAEGLRKIAELARVVAEQTSEVEAEETNLKEMREKRGQTLEEMLGNMMSKKNMQLSDMKEFDTNADGVIDKKEFRQMLRSVGIKGVDGALIDELHERLDKDQNGTLDLSELKDSLHKLQSAAAKSVEDLTDEAQLVSEMVKMAARQQAKFAAAAAAIEKPLPAKVSMAAELA